MRLGIKHENKFSEIKKVLLESDSVTDFALSTNHKFALLIQLFSHVASDKRPCYCAESPRRLSHESEKVQRKQRGFDGPIKLHV